MGEARGEDREAVGEMFRLLDVDDALGLILLSGSVEAEEQGEGQWTAKEGEVHHSRASTTQQCPHWKALFFLEERRPSRCMPAKET